MDDKVFELIEKMYSEMQEGFKGVKLEIDGVKTDIGEVKSDVSGINQQMVSFEDKMDINHKVLHDGYKQNSEKLDRIEEVSKHEEIILRRIK